MEKPNTTELESKKLIDHQPSEMHLAALKLISIGAHPENLTDTQKIAFDEVLGYVEDSLSYAIFKRIKNKQFETGGIAREHEVGDYIYRHVYGESNPYFTREDINNKIQEMKKQKIIILGGPKMDLNLLQLNRTDEYTPYFPEWIKKGVWTEYMKKKTN